jgi:hypothetical protein
MLPILNNGAIYAATAGESLNEYEVKAAYIYYFAKFTDWSTENLPQPMTPLVIGVIGDNEFGSIMESVVKGKTIETHAIQVHIIKSFADAKKCNIVFISASEGQHALQFLENLQTESILTVTESEEHSKPRGIINLLVENGKVRFEVDLSMAEKARLKLSSKLLRLAR